MQQNVTISRFQNAIIAKAYEKFCLTGPHISINMVELDKLAKETNLDPAEIDSQTRALKHLGLLSTGDTFSDHATWLCLDTYERNYPSDRVYANNKVRRLLFDIAYEHRNNQAGGYVSEETVYADQRVKELSEDIIYANVWFLQESGYAEGSLRSGMGFMYRIGDYALAIDKQKRAEEFPISANDRVSLETVSEVIQTWVPRQKRRVEESYKAELAEYLRNYGYPKTREEEGQSNPDILVDETLPVEMKKDPDQSELDRMSGQMMRMVEEFGVVIACVVQSKPGLDRLERFKKQWQSNDKVRVIIKPV